MSSLERHPLVVFITLHPGLAERLLRTHVDDGSGHCSSCRIGAQAGNHRWPCTIARCAQVARSGR